MAQLAQPHANESTTASDVRVEGVAHSASEPPNAPPPPPHVGAYDENMLTSTFCLTPSGHTCTSRRFYDAVAGLAAPPRTRACGRP